MRTTGAIDVLGPSIGRFALWEEDRLIGYLNCWQLERGMTIMDVFVQPDRQRKGYGRMLVEHFEEAAQQAGFTRIWLSMVDDKALGFWVRMGYEGHYHDGCGNCGFHKRLE